MDLGSCCNKKAERTGTDNTIREIHVGFANEEIKQSFEALKSGKFEDKQMFEFIQRAIDDLSRNPLIGINIPKNLIPKEYIIKFEVDNLRKYDLPNGWRLLYTIKGDELMIVSILIEWLDHKSYERRFKY